MAQTNGGRGQCISVVINTYNRGPSLRHTLHALRYQTHEAFEVVVVNGPSTDDTAAVLAEFPDARVAHCPEVHLSKSRNVGVAEAAGDIVAFIDDDALPEPTWLEELAAAYDADKVGGAGGFTYDHTGFHYQYRYSTCDRLGNTRFDVVPPFDALNRPGADPFLFLQGTNCSFLRSCLVAIGGFDEEIEYYMDEVDVCRRVLDLGYELRPLDGAPVHHKYLASHRRNNKKVVFEPFPNVKNHCYLALLNNLDKRPLDELKAILRKFADGVKAVAYANHAAGKFTDAQRDHFLAEVERGLEVGIEKGLKGQRLHREFPPADPARFQPYGTLRPAGGRLRVCFVSQEYPPGDFGGIGRFTADLASGFAALGHEVHVVTRSSDSNRVDFEDGVWLHRLAAPERYVAELEQAPLGGNLFHSSGVYHEVRRIHDRRPLDVVSAPLWACEGLVCALDRERFPTVLTLMTSMNTIAAMHPSWGGSATIKQVIALEQAAAREARYLHPISKAILEKVRADYGAREGWAQVQPLGVRDRRGQYLRRRPEGDGKVRVLFVGRLERRKGVDVLLEAAVRLLKRFPQAEFVLAGKDTPNTETGTTYRAQFQERYGADPAIAGRVAFAGAVSEDELYQHYADADVVCMPSRYESFGLVLVEGMVFGRPVVGCAVGGMCEIVEAGGSGLLARPGDADSLEECLARLLADADLRRAYGARGRVLYEQHFALPLVVDRTAEFYRAIVARHAQAGHQAAGTEALARRLARVVTRVAGVPARAAGPAAAALLDPSCYPVDYLAVVRRLCHEPEEAFLSGLYGLLLNRDLDDEGKAHFLGALRSGASRVEVVRMLALTPEARQSGRPVAWLDALERQPTPPSLPKRAWRLFKRVAHAALGRGADPPRSLLARLGRKVRSAVSPRTLVRYAKRVVYLPWNFQKVYDALPSLHEQARQQTDLQMQVQQSITQTLVVFTREVLLRQEYLERRLSQTLEAISAEVHEKVEHHHKAAYQELRQLKTRFADFYGSLVADQQEQTRLTADLSRSVEDLRQALRGRGAAAAPSSDGKMASPPRILNLDVYKTRLGRMGDAVRVNVGGGRALVDYINVGARPGPGVDVVADALNLPFAPGTLAEIACAHVIDRYAPEHFASVVLPYWKDLLRPGGSLRIVAPNWDALVGRLCGGEFGTAEFLRAVSGGLATQGAAPSALYTPRGLADLLRRHGFTRVEILAEARGDGACPEMELVAHLPAQSGQKALLTAG